MGQEIAKSFKRIDQIFKQIKVEVRQLLDINLAPRFKTNALEEITSTDLAELLETIQRILDRICYQAQKMVGGYGLIHLLILQPKKARNPQ